MHLRIPKLCGKLLTTWGTVTYSSRTMTHGVSKLRGRLVGRSYTDSNCRSKEWHNAIVWNSPLKRVCLGTSTASTPIEFHWNKTTQSECWQRTPGTDSKQDVSIIMANQTFQLSASWTIYLQQMTTNCSSNLVITRDTRRPSPSKTETRYVHATTHNSEILFNTRLQWRYFNERNNVSEPSVSIKQEFPGQLSKCCLVLSDWTTLFTSRLWGLPRLFPRKQSGRSVRLSTHLGLVPTVRISGAITLSIPSYTVMTCIGKILLLQEWSRRPNRPLTSTVRYLHDFPSRDNFTFTTFVYDCSNITTHKVFRSMTRIQRVAVGLCSQKTNVNIKPPRKTLNQ
jgi:hypothetical protein